jgi:hypothetical protein
MHAALKNLAERAYQLPTAVLAGSPARTGPGEREREREREAGRARTSHDSHLPTTAPPRPRTRRLLPSHETPPGAGRTGCSIGWAPSPVPVRPASSPRIVHRQPDGARPRHGASADRDKESSWTIAGACLCLCLPVVVWWMVTCTDPTASRLSCLLACLTTARVQYVVATFSPGRTVLCVLRPYVSRGRRPS